MWAPHHAPPPIEKIRKAQWTPENTATTQRIVDELHASRVALHLVFGEACPAVGALQRAIARFRELDPGVSDPAAPSKGRT